MSEVDFAPQDFAPNDEEETTKIEESPHLCPDDINIINKIREILENSSDLEDSNGLLANIKSLCNDIVTPNLSDQDFSKLCKDFAGNVINFIFSTDFNDNIKYAVTKLFCSQEITIDFDSPDLKENQINNLLFERKNDIKFTDKATKLFGGLISAFIGSEKIKVLENEESTEPICMRTVTFLNSILQFLKPDVFSAAITYSINQLNKKLSKDVTPDFVMICSKFFADYCKYTHGLSNGMILSIATNYFNLESRANKTKLVEYSIKIALLGSPLSSAEPLKRILLNSLEWVQNDMLALQIIECLTSLVGMVPFEQKDADVILSRSGSLPQTCSDAIIKIYSNYYESLDTIALDIMPYGQYNVFSPALWAFLIDKADEHSYSQKLFSQLAETKPKSRSDRLELRAGDKCIYLFKEELNSSEPNVSIKNLGNILLRIIKPDLTVLYIEKIFQYGVFNSDIEYVFLEIPQMISKNDLDKPILCFFEALVFSFTGPQNFNFVSNMARLFAHWINTASSIPENMLIQRFTQMDYSNAHVCLPRILQAVSERTSNKRSIRLLIQKILKDTVPPQLARWFTTYILTVIGDEKSRDSEKICEALSAALTDSSKVSSIIPIIISIAQLEADYFRIGEQFGFVQKCLIIKDGEEMECTVSLHPFHTTMRFYTEVRAMLELPANSFQLYYESNNKYMRPRMPLTDVPLSYNGILRLKLVRTQLTNDEIPEIQNSQTLGTIVKDEVASQLFNTLAHLNAQSQQVYLVLELLGRTNYSLPPVMSEFQNIFMKRFTFSMELAEYTKIFPFVLSNFADTHQSIPQATVEQILEILTTANFDKVSLAIAVSSIVQLVPKDGYIFSHHILHDCLITCNRDLVRQGVAAMMSYETSKDSLISLISYATQKENRSKTREFFGLERVRNDIDSYVFDSFFRDLKQFETSYNSDVDVTLISMLELITKTDENMEIVYKMLFSPPTCQSKYSPFIQTQESRNAAIKFLASFDCFERIKLFCEKADFTSAKILTDDFTFHPLSTFTGVQDFSAFPAILQVLFSLSCFNALFLDSNVTAANDSPIVQTFKETISLSRNLRSCIIPLDKLVSDTYIRNIVNRLPDSLFISLIAHLDHQLGMAANLKGLFESRVVSKSNKCDISRQALQSRLTITLKTEGFDNLNDSLASFINENEVRLWPRVLVISLDRGDPKKAKLSHEFQIPQFISHPNGSINNYRLAAAVIHNGSVLVNGKFSTITKTSENEWFINDNETISSFDINDFPKHAFGITDPLFNNGVRSATLLFYVQEGFSVKCDTVPQKLIDTIDKENCEFWPLKVCTSESFSDLLLTQFRGEKHHRVFFLNYFFHIGSKTSKFQEWCKKISDSVLVDKSGADLYLKELEKIDIAQMATSNVSAVESLMKLAALALHFVENSEEMFNAIIESFNTVDNWVTYDILCAFVSEFIKSHKASLNPHLLRTTITALTDKRDPMTVSASKNIGDCLDTILNTIEEFAKEKGDESISALEEIFDSTFLGTFSERNATSQKFQELLTLTAENYPDMIAAVEQFIPGSLRSSVMSKIHASEMKDADDDTPEIPYELVIPELENQIFSLDEEAREIAYNCLISFCGKENREIRDYLSEAFFDESLQIPEINEEDTATYIIPLFIPRVHEFIENERDEVRVLEFSKLLKELSLNSPSVTSRHLKEILDILLKAKDEEIAENIFEAFVNSAILDEEMLDDDIKGEFATLTKAFNRKCIQILALLKEKANASPFAAACINFCLSQDFDETSELLEKIIKEGLNPGQIEIPEDTSNKKLAKTLSDLIEQENEPKAKTSNSPKKKKKK